VSQDVIIREEDCGTDDHISAADPRPGRPNKSLTGRIRAEDVHKPLKDGKPGKTVLGTKGERSRFQADRDRRGARGVAETFQLPVRSVLKCRAETGCVPGVLRHVPRHRRALRDRRRGRHHRRAVDRRAGHAADDADVPHRRCRGCGHHARPAAVVEIFEARNPKGAAQLAEVSGRVEIEDEPGRGPKVTVVPDALDENGEPIPSKEYQLPRRTRLLVTNGQVVEAGDALHEGSLNPSELLLLKGSTRRSSTSSARCRRSTARRAWTSTTSTSS
jgi:DNA-directed RNA polymerase subunit beta'